MNKSRQNKNINVLDCTFRDGGYYNHWNFDLKLIKKYIDIMLRLDVKIIELGFRFLETNQNLGILATTTDDLLDRLKIPKKVKSCSYD
jgi:hypothetical protein